MGDAFTARQPRAEGGRRAESKWGHAYESPERFAREVHRPNVPFAQDAFEFIIGDPHHQVAPDDAAAHSAPAQKRETAEHLPFGDISPCSEHLSISIREVLIVCHLSHRAHDVLEAEGSDAEINFYVIDPHVGGNIGETQLSF